MTSLLSFADQGGEVVWHRSVPNVMPTFAPALLANNTRVVLWLGSIAGSTISLLCPTNIRGDSLPVFLRSNMVAEALSGWHRSLACTATPLLVGGANCNTAARKRGARFAGLAPVGHALKKKSDGSEDFGGTAPGCDGRRPCLRPQVDAPFAPQDPKGIAPAQSETDTTDYRPAASPIAFCFENQPQTPGWHSRSRP